MTLPQAIKLANNLRKFHFFNVSAPLYRKILSEDTNITVADIIKAFYLSLKRNLDGIPAMMIDVYSVAKGEHGFSIYKYHSDDFHLGNEILMKIESQLN